MAQSTSSGAIVSERDIVAHTINTGQMTQHIHLHVTVMVGATGRAAAPT